MSRLCLIFALATAVFAAADEPTPNQLFLDGDIEIAVAADGVVTVSWQTLEPSPPGMVWVGLVPEDAEIAVPVYRRYGREAGEAASTEHSATFELSPFERPVYDASGLIENGGGVIHIRLECWDLGVNTARLFHTRFAYTRSGDGVYERIPCVTLGPVVDCVNDTTAVLSWETDMPVFCHIAIGEPGGPLTEVIRTGALGEEREWIWEVDDLAPDSEVAYRVIVEDPHGGGALPSSTPARVFRTAPETGSDAPFRFALMSDSRAGSGGAEANVSSMNWGALQRLSAEAHRHGANLFLFAGDLVNGYTASPRDFANQLRTWRQAMEPVAALMPVYEGVGNHEAVGPPNPDRPTRIWRSYTDENSPGAVFGRQFINPENGPGPEEIDGVEGPPYGETVYSFDWGNAHFVSINSNYWWKSMSDGLPDEPGNREGFVMDGQLAWLDADLADARERGQDHLFVYTHEPMFPNGGHIGDAMYWNGRIPEVLAMRDRLAEILSRHGVLVIFFGDEHNYSRTLVDSTICDTVDQPFWQMVSGGAGAPYYNQQETPWSDNVAAFSIQNHFILVEVDGPDVTAQVISRDGQILDEVDLISDLAD